MTTRQMLPLLLAILTTLFLLTGCGEDDPVSPRATGPTADQDAAEVVATELGADSGGLTDQMADLAAAVEGLDTAKSLPREGFAMADYDAVTGTWTITIERERGVPDGVPYAAISRVYTLRFLDADGQPQPYRIAAGDTARTVEFAIVSGTGEHRTRRLDQQLDELSGSFVVTDVHTDLLTVNGTYHRAASNVLEGRDFLRTHASVLDLTVTDAVVPLGSARDLSEAISGTLTGVYTAEITVQRGDAYAERSVERAFTVVFGDGQADISINGSGFIGNVGSGELIE